MNSHDDVVWADATDDDHPLARITAAPLSVVAALFSDTRAGVFSGRTLPGVEDSSPARAAVLFAQRWPFARLIWIGHSKNQPSSCQLAALPADVVRLIR